MLQDKKWIKNHKNERNHVNETDSTRQSGKEINSGKLNIKIIRDDIRNN